MSRTARASEMAAVVGPPLVGAAAEHASQADREAHDDQEATIAGEAVALAPNDPASAWASFIEGHNLGQQPWSPARLALHAMVAVQMALGVYGSWHSGPSLLDERCRDLGGYVFTLTGGLTLYVLQVGLSWLRSSLVLNLLKRHRQDGLHNLTPAHMVKYARAMQASQDLTTHASLGLPMLLLMTWLWANAVDEESGCLDRYPALAKAFLVYAWTGRVLAVLFVVGTCLQCVSPAKVLDLLQLSHVVRGQSQRPSMAATRSGSSSSSSFLDVTYEAALDLLDFGGRRQYRVARAAVRSGAQPGSQRPPAEVEEVVVDGVQLQGRNSQEDYVQYRHEVVVNEVEEEEDVSDGEEEEDEEERTALLAPPPDDGRGEEWSSWDVLHWSLWALLHMVVLVVIGFSAYSLTGTGLHHYPSCGSVEGFLVTLTLAFSAYLSFAWSFYQRVLRSHGLTRDDVSQAISLARLLVVLLAASMFGGLLLLNQEVCYDEAPHLLDPVLGYVLVGSSLIVLGLMTYSFFFVLWAAGSTARIVSSLYHASALLLDLALPKDVLLADDDAGDTSIPLHPPTPTLPPSTIIPQAEGAASASTAAWSSTSVALPSAEEVPLPFFRVTVLQPLVGHATLLHHHHDPATPLQPHHAAGREGATTTTVSVITPAVEQQPRSAWTERGIEAIPLDTLFDVIPWTHPSTFSLQPTTSGRGPRRRNSSITRELSLPVEQGYIHRDSFSTLDQAQLGPIM